MKSAYLIKYRLVLVLHLSRQGGEEVTPYTCVVEVPSSNLRPVTSCSVMFYHHHLQSHLAKPELLLRGSAVRERTLTASNMGGFLILFRHSVGLLWTNDHPIAEVSTYTRQHNTERQGQTSMPQAGFEPTVSACNRPRPTPQTARPPEPAANPRYYPEIRHDTPPDKRA
jgi:hypothetical protein